MTNEGKKFLNTEVNKLHGFIYMLDQIAEKILQDNLDITYPDFLMMMVLDNMGASSQQQLSNYLHVTKSSISKRVDTLSKKNLLIRVSNPDNRRENIVHLSDQGIDTITKAYLFLDKASDPFFKVLEDKRDDFSEMVDVLLKEIRHDHNH